MSTLITIAAVAALIGAALIGGVFFAFSSFIMKALGRLPSQEGIAAMQSINVVVLNRTFLGLFTGTAAICVLVIVLAVMEWGGARGWYFVEGALLYIVGTFLVTTFGNVPLNDQLEAVEAASPEAAALWQHYLVRWTSFNTLRTVAAALSALAFTLALLQGS